MAGFFHPAGFHPAGMRCPDVAVSHASGETPPSPMPTGRGDGLGTVIGDLLPLAVAVAISPMPIVVILMLLSARAGSASKGFLAGWVVGLCSVTLIVMSLAASVGMGTRTEPSEVASVLSLLLGLGLILLALKQWRSRSASREPPQLPKWMAGIERYTAGK